MPKQKVQVEFDVPYGYEVELSKPSDYPKDGPGMYIKFRLRKISKPGFIKEDRVKLLEYKPEIQR